MCRQFFEDLLGGWVVTVRLSFSDRRVAAVDNPAYESVAVSVDEILFDGYDGMLEVPLGDSSMVVLSGPDAADHQLPGMRAAAGDEPIIGVLMPTDSPDSLPWRINAVVDETGFHSGDRCAPTYSAAFLGAAEILGSGPSDTVEAINGYLCNPDDPRLLAVAHALGEFSNGVPQPLPPTSVSMTEEELWLRIPAETRELDYSTMPAGIAERVELYGLAIRLQDSAPLAELFVRCELGIGIGVLTDFDEIVRAVPLCRETPTEIVYADALIATFPPSAFDIELGNRLTIGTLASGEPVVELTPLLPGELETLTGMSREQLDEYRDQVKAGQIPNS